MRIELLSIVVLLSACGRVEQSQVDHTPKSSPPANEVTQASDVSINPNRNAYFGDLHVHTTNSFDAYIFNVRVTADDAYRFAKGQPIRHDAGYEIQLFGPPLDFLAVTDHGEYLGVLPAMDTEGHRLSKTETAKTAFGPNREDATAVFQQIGASFVTGQPIAEINDQQHMNSVWAETVDAAERHYQPGRFTTFAGYEFTAMRLLSAEALAASNLHRNVIFRDAAPDQLFTTLNSTNPEDLWDWMDDQRSKGRDAIAIPHNSNASNGEMFALETYLGDEIDREYAVQRSKNEPLVEISQIKGTSDTHPLLSPNDEWADFERYDYYIGSSVKATVNDGDYVRKALAEGLAFEETVGANPYKVGIIGSSDTHIAAATLDEQNHWGKFPTDGASPQARFSVPPDDFVDWNDVKFPEGSVLTGSQYSASGLAGVWAESNTREAIFDAMRRRETFGTSGPRLKVRFFAGDAYDPSIIEATDLLDQAYAGGVPMGGDLLLASDDEAPTFIAWAMRDPNSAPLDRLQIIKVWQEAGKLDEAVFDVACSDGAQPDDETFRCADNGASVNLDTCETDPGSGANELKTVWVDPTYVSGQTASYYIRVLENPTCRWSTWDAVRAGTPPNPNLPTTLQERAWSSPIWVSQGE